jgi:MFS family permease
MAKGLSTLEHVLTMHLRGWLQGMLSNKHIRILSFTLSLSTCLLDASVAIFSIFTMSFIKELGFNTLDINIISSSMLIGLYLTLPLLGYLSDLHGPVLLAIIGFSLTPGYLLAQYVIKELMSVWIMAIAFFFIGMGTSSSYFCSLLTCAKIFPDRKGLSISLPVSCYGLSAFLLSWLFNLKIFKNDDLSLNVEKVFHILAIMYTIVGLINWIGSVVVSIEKEILYAEMYSEEGYGSLESVNEVTGEDVITLQALQKEKFSAFLKDPSMGIVLGALLCLAGPMEVFVANMGVISGNFESQDDVSAAVGMFSILSTATRLAVGIIGDRGWLGNSVSGSVRMIQLAGILALSGLVTVGSFVEKVPGIFVIASGIIGIAYGIVFTAFPTLVASLWGVEIFGSTWGLFLGAPAVGSCLFGGLYALGVGVDALGGICMIGGILCNGLKLHRVRRV